MGESTGRSIFEIVLIDVSNLDSVRSAVASLNEPIDALIMNAGGMGGKEPNALTKDGVIQIFSTNVLGHVLLLDELIAANKLNNVTTTVNETMQTKRIDLQLFSNSMPMISTPIYFMMASAKITVDPANTKTNVENNIEMSTT